MHPFIDIGDGLYTPAELYKICGDIRMGVEVRQQHLKILNHFNISTERRPDTIRAELFTAINKLLGVNMEDKIIGYAISEIERIRDSIQQGTAITRTQVDLLNHLNIAYRAQDGARLVRRLIDVRIEELSKRGKWA